MDQILAQLFKWPQAQIDAYLRATVMAAGHSAGGLVSDVPRTVHDCPDHENNLILDLAAEVGARSSSPATPICCPCRRGVERRSSSQPRSPQRSAQCAGTRADDADRSQLAEYPRTPGSRTSSTRTVGNAGLRR
jgi:hypothetical protein